MQLAPIAIGRIDIQYRRVECVPPAAMVVFVDNNNGPGGWLRLFIGKCCHHTAMHQSLQLQKQPFQKDCLAKGPHLS